MWISRESVREKLIWWCGCVQTKKLNLFHLGAWEAKTNKKKITGGAHYADPVLEPGLNQSCFTWGGNLFLRFAAGTSGSATFWTTGNLLYPVQIFSLGVPET